MTELAERQTSHSVIRNVLFGLVTWILPLCLGLVATPILVGSLGHSEYGLFALILGLVGYSFTFNFGRAITKYVAEYRATGRTQDIAGIISSSLTLNITIGLAGSIVLCLLADWLVRDVFAIPAPEQQQTVNAIYLASAIIFFTMLSQVFSSVLHGLQRFDVYSKIFSIHSVLLVSGNIVLALLNFDLLGLLEFNLALLVGFCIIYAIAAARLLPGPIFGISLGKGILRKIVAYSGAIVAYQVLGNLVLLFERGWITQRLGSESLTYYVVPMSLGIYLHGFVSSLVLVVFPLASELEHDRHRLQKLYTKATKLISAMVVFIVLSVLIVNERFFTLWMGADFAVVASPLLVPHIICFGLFAILTISWQMTEGLGRPHFNAILTAVSSLICISLMVALIVPYGLLGVAVARLIGFGTIFFSIFLAERSFFGAVQSDFWLTHLCRVVPAAAAAAIGEYVLAMFLPFGWLPLIGIVAAGAAVYALVLWLLDFVTADEKLLLREIAKRAR
ncbi:MAG: oligosaccharide flippase family protein [Pyrinomonadaceae bacterium]|nr:oligosaccharide flippase family protein [Pyrinomonadaceae bacterium]